MMTEYWIWLSRTLGAGAKIGDMISYFGSPREMYEAGRNEWKLSGLLTAKQISSLSKFSPSESYSIFKACEQNRWHIIDFDSSFYPALLRDLPDFPAVLFADGDYKVLKSAVPIAFVGTRKASEYSKKIAYKLSFSVAGSGAVIVSGGALGIDSASHEGALAANGKTVAVLGNGLGFDYLHQNEDLRRRISNQGVVISEFMPFTEASRTTFPIRNRIISGMSLGTVVIEAGEKSGSLITASLAAAQGRDVFAVPGDIVGSSYNGANNLIRDGATPVFSANDILGSYYYLFPELKQPDENTVFESKTVASAFSRQEEEKIEPPRQIQKKECPEALSPDAKKVYAVFSAEELHIDEITEKSGLTPSKTLGALTELEIYGLVKLNNGRKYQIN